MNKAWVLGSWMLTCGVASGPLGCSGSAGDTGVGDADATTGGAAASGGSLSSGGSATSGGSTSVGGSANTGGTTSGSGGTGGDLFGGGEGGFPSLTLPLPTAAEVAQAPCPAGSTLEKLETPALYSWPGTVFGSVMPTGQGANHAPVALQLRVTNQGAPVSGCEVRFVGGDGWGKMSKPLTDADGEATAYWIAGEPGANAITARIALDGGGESTVDFSGQVDEHESRTDSVYVDYEVEASYTEFKVRITPLTAPPATYYSALNWRDSYAGIQFDGEGANRTSTVIFSVWDAGGEDAVISDQGDCNVTVGFGGEGTGTSCRLEFPPADFGSIAGLPEDYQLVPGDSYELHLVTAATATGTSNTITFTDLTRGLGPISLGTQTTGTDFTGGSYASGFVEEWTPHGSCLSSTRAVLYHGMQALVDGAWSSVARAQFSSNYLKTNNEICGNYSGSIYSGTFLLSSGGSDFVGLPYIPGDDAFPHYQGWLDLP